MPLDGNDVASKPAGTTAVSGTTIESSKFNSVVNDIYAIFNTARSIAKGFTGASSAQGALDNFFDGSSYVKASKMLIADDTDTSKKLKFDLSGFHRPDPHAHAPELQRHDCHAGGYREPDQQDADLADDQHLDQPASRGH